MGALQKVIANVLSRLRDISASQRIALLLGGALVAVSLVWLLQWAATPEMVPVLDQNLSPEDIALVKSGLDAMGEPCDVRGDRVYVRASTNRQAIYAQLQQLEKLPADTSVGFAALIKESDPWISMAESNRRWTFALQQSLAQVLRQLNGVKSANVFLNLGTQKKSFARAQPPSSASVTLVMKHGDEVSRSLALAAARLVAGAVSGLPVHNVEVVDATTGRVALDWDTERDVTTLLDRKLAKEELRYAEKIRRIIPDDKALLSVQVDLNSTSSNTQTEQPLKGVAKTERMTEQETTRGRQSEQPGVQPNVGVAAGGGTIAETHDERTSDIETEVGLARKVETTPAGDVQKVTAAVSLSHTYLAGVFRQAAPEAEPPTDAQVEEVFQRERARLLSQVVQLVRPQAEENVAISWYYDAAVVLPSAGASGALDEALDLARSYGPQSALALLALASLGMMLRMARKSDAGGAFGLELGLPQEAIDAAKAAASDVRIIAGRSAAGGGRADQGGVEVVGGGRGPEGELAETEMTAAVEQASATEGVLVAQEVDAGTVQIRKMLDQVAQMAENDPEAMAMLVEQWMQRNDQYHEEGV